jgi:Ca2+-binding EF-hand superfamily protein
MHHRTIIAVGALIGLSLASTTWAKHHGMELPMSVDQAEARASAAFARADANADGKLTAEEFAAAELPQRRETRRGPHGQRGAEHGAGRMDAEQQAAYEAELFDALDRDGSNCLSREEASRERRHAAHQALRKQHMFSRLDSDANGVIDQTEFSQRVQRLKQLDQNQDGEITREEFRSGMQARRHAG